MALQVWLPLNGDLHNQGLSNITVTNNGTAVDNNGKIGKCYSFNGSSNYLFGSASGLNNSTTEYSYACWLKLNNTSHTGCLFSSRTSASATGFTIFYASGHFYFDEGQRWDFTPASALVANTWYHICFTWKKDVGIKYYCNGVLKNQTTTTHTPTTVSTQFTIGKSQSTATTVNPSAGNPLNGYLNDVRVYDHCLSAKEVEEIAKGLVLHYKLDGYINNIIYDSSGYQNNGTIVGSLTAAAGSPRYDVATDFSSGSITGSAFNYCDQKDITISFWAYSQDWSVTSSSTRSIFTNYSENNGIRIYRGINANRMRLQYGTTALSDGAISNTTIYLHSTSVFPENSWQHFTVTLDSSSGRTIATTYLNGEKYTSNNLQSLFHHTQTNNFTLRSPEPNEGKIVDFRVYTTALTADQIKELYNTSMSVDASGNIYARELSELV